jgi:hypothetical protein
VVFISFDLDSKPIFKMVLENKYIYKKREEKKNKLTFLTCAARWPGGLRHASLPLSLLVLGRRAEQPVSPSRSLACGPAQEASRARLPSLLLR